MRNVKAEGHKSGPKGARIVLDVEAIRARISAGESVHRCGDVERVARIAEQTIEPQEGAAPSPRTGSRVPPSAHQFTEASFSARDISR